MEPGPAHLLYPVACPGKPTQVVLTAAMRQRLTLRNALKRDQTPWQEITLTGSQA